MGPASEARKPAKWLLQEQPETGFPAARWTAFSMVGEGLLALVRSASGPLRLPGAPGRMNLDTGLRRFPFGETAVFGSVAACPALEKGPSRTSLNGRGRVETRLLVDL